LPQLPELHAIVVILLTGLAMFLFTKDRIPLETTGLGVLVLLVLMFYFFPYKNIEPKDFFINFGHEALVTICALLILGRGLETTGALQPLATMMSKHWLERPTIALAGTLVVGAVCSAFLNNTPIVVMLLPVLVSVCMRAGRPASKILMPMGLATGPDCRWCGLIVPVADSAATAAGSQSIYDRHVTAPVQRGPVYQRGGLCPRQNIVRNPREDRGPHAR